MSGCQQRLALSVATLAILGIAAPAAQAQSSPLARAHADWKDQEYERVIKRADEALRSPALSRAQRIEALRLKGASHAVLGETAAAAKTFERLLTVDPRFRMPRGTSPRILAVFEPTRARWLLERETALRERLGADLAAMRLEVSLPSQPRGGVPLPVSVQLVDPKRLATEVRVFYRRRGTRSYSVVSGRTHGAQTRIDIPAVFTASKTPYELDVYVEVLHESGVALLRKGNATGPLSLAMRPGSVPRPVPIYKRWWFWVGTAVLSVALPVLIDQAIDVGPQKVVGTR